MILLWMFLAFKVEVLEIVGSFRVWFQQSFNTSESSLMLLACALDGLIPLRSLGPLLWNALGRLLFIGFWGWVSNMWRSLIGDICHSLTGPLMSSLTRAGLLMLSLTHADMWLVFTCILCLYFNDTWQISVGF